MKRTFLRFAFVYLLCSAGILPRALGQGAVPALGSSDYRNRLFVPAPNPQSVPISGVQPRSVSVVGGDVRARIPGAVSLVRSTFGQAATTGPLLRPSAGVGGIVTPAEPFLAGLKPTAIDGNAFWLESTRQLIATGPGLVTVSWGSTNRQYFVSTEASRPPMGIYWKETPDRDPGGPAVSIPPSIGVTFLWSPSVPAGTLSITGNSLTANTNGLGLIVLVYTNKSSGAYLATEIVDVRSSEPDRSIRRESVIGSFLQPATVVPNPGPVTIRRGFSPDEDGGYLHRYVRPGDPQTGRAFAFRPTTAPHQINAFWTRTGAAGIVWPYEMVSYDAIWPRNLEEVAMRIYLTDDATGSPTTSPPVDLSAIPGIEIHYNDSIPRGANQVGRSTNLWLVGKNLRGANRVGPVLLTYEDVAGVVPGFIGFQIVQVVPNVPDRIVTVDVGTALAPARVFDSPVLPGLVSRGGQSPPGEAPLVYTHGVDGPMKGLIYPVRRFAASQVEVFWFRKGLRDVKWPYEMANYSAQWTANPQRFVRGSTPDARGATVNVPVGLNAEITHQEPANIATLSAQAVLGASPGGHLLLKYSVGNPVGSNVFFQTVRTVAHNESIPPATAALIGAEISDPSHMVSTTDARNARPGYVHVATGVIPREDRYAVAPYASNGQIFPVNTGKLEVWWMNLDSFGIQWPSIVKRYDARWNASAPTIVIADGRGTGGIDPQQFPDSQIYFQNDATQPGYNPNDEHASFQSSRSGPLQAVFALRSDLGSSETSLPYVLVSHVRPDNRRAFRVWRVIAEADGQSFDQRSLAGRRLVPPYPLGMFQTENSMSRGVSGPFWKDRKDAFWAMAAGNDGGPANIGMGWFYRLSPGFAMPQGDPAKPGDLVPWLDRHANTPGTPLRVGTQVYWADSIPANLQGSLASAEYPRLATAETLIHAKRGLPEIADQCSVEILYQQSSARLNLKSVELIDPTRARGVALDRVPADVVTERTGGLVYFPKLPTTLRSRIHFDPTQRKLFVRGTNVPSLAGDYLLPNVITAREATILRDPEFRGADATFQSAINGLINVAAAPVLIDPADPAIDSKALSAGIAQGSGYVTLAMGNSKTSCTEANPVSLEIIRVECPLNYGGVVEVEPASPFEEQITMRFSGDLGGRGDSYTFEWRYMPAVNGTVPPTPDQPNAPNWLPLQSNPSDGKGASDITLAGPGLLTLADQWITCRYRSVDSRNPCGTTTWSSWTAPALKTGWIKRVVAGLSPFEQRFFEFGDPTQTVDTTITMIREAGKRWEGTTPMDGAKVSQLGLIELYETVLKRGVALSIEAVPPVSDPGIDDQLMLVAGRLADLYMLLGNEAYAGASDPTISVGTAPDLAYVAAGPSLHAFMNMVPDLLEEQLGLLRGRDDQVAPGVTLAPVYNRLYWNFTSDLAETAYVLKHQIADELGNKDGVTSELDAALLYPQGHGDAWGHYLTSIKYFYRLFRNPSLRWEPRSEIQTVGGIPITVNFKNERKFARAAAAKARAGAEIVNLTHRALYDEDVANQWSGYRDSVQSPKSPRLLQREPRAWGLADWGSRAGQGALLDWITGNALLPDVDAAPHGDPMQRVDRTTVVEFGEVAAALDSIQSEVDRADGGLNPLGLASNVMPFDIDSSQISIDGGRTHFEQIYDRAVTTLNNALTVFNYANNSTQQLRRQADEATEFNKLAAQQAADYRNRLIEIYGTPYPEDIGNNGQNYPAGYDGPDLDHYDYVDVQQLLGTANTEASVVEIPRVTTAVNDRDATVTYRTNLIQLNVSIHGHGLTKPAAWSGRRAAYGEIQLTRSELLQSGFRFLQGLSNYNLLIGQIKGEADVLRARYDLKGNELVIQNTLLNESRRLDEAIRGYTELELHMRRGARVADGTAIGVAEMMPKFFIAGTAVGGDFSSVARGITRLAGTAVSETFQALGDKEQVKILAAQQEKAQAELRSNIQISTTRNEVEFKAATVRLLELVRQEAPLAVELDVLYSAVQANMARYQSAIARGLRLQQEFTRFQRETASRVQTARYKDMAFRIFRNDALQKFQAQFDLAAAYVFMAARAFDFETNFDPSDFRSPRKLMARIVRSRAIGLIQNGVPQTGGATGDPGLTDSMARMMQNWTALKPQLGFNNPQREQTQFSLRREFFRIPSTGASNDVLWRATLARHVVPDLTDLPEFRRYARFVPGQAQEPGIVIPFGTTIDLGLNFFGRPLGGADRAYDASRFATKIRSVAVWFNNFNNLALADTPRVFLIPLGADVMRSPVGNVNRTREWVMLEQSIPVPFSLGGNVPSSSTWIPSQDSLNGDFADIRQYAPFRAYHDGGYNLSQVTYDSRLVGRSVWNTQWWLVIPAGYLSSNRDEGLQRLIHGALVNGTRDGNGIKDIQLLFQTYSYQGQ